MCSWESAARGAWRLVRDLAEALEFEAGAMWVARGDALAVCEVWQARGQRVPEGQSALNEACVGTARARAGRAFTLAEPVFAGDLIGGVAERALRTPEARTGLRALRAVPVVDDEEVLAVLVFAARERVVFTGSFVRSLAGIGVQIGQFVARRRRELSPPPLTPRKPEVLQLSATGYARRQIADQVGVSEATVKDSLRAHLPKARHIRPRVGGR